MNAPVLLAAAQLLDRAAVTKSKEGRGERGTKSKRNASWVSCLRGK